MHYIYIFWIAGKGIIRPKSLQKRIMSEDLRSVYSRAPEIFQRLRKEIDKVIVGQDRAIEQLLVSIIAGGHALLESNPALAKTLLVKTTASCMGLDFSRIQCTPDLMPADITGTTIIDEIGGGKKFRFEPGPVFSNIVLADEINRASPKTQSALLEAMQEKQVTVGNKTYALDRPFFILATQNPIEMEGTFPLPEAQLDRFLLKIFMEYPTMDEEMEILERYTIRAEPKVSPQVSKEEVIALQQLCRDIPIADDLKRAVVNLVLATRNWDGVQYGASPRASIGLILSAKARAFLQGRNYVSKEDLHVMAYPVLRHRIILGFEAERKGLTRDQVVGDILKSLSL
jgi:MoxR-like ATPase